MQEIKFEITNEQAQRFKAYLAAEFSAQADTSLSALVRYQLLAHIRELAAAEAAEAEAALAADNG